jgi:hypothetical protein
VELAKDLVYPWVGEGTSYLGATAVAPGVLGKLRSIVRPAAITERNDVILPIGAVRVLDEQRVIIAACALTRQT